MPRGDGTGPNGIGPMSGRGAGYCAGYNAPGFANAGLGCGAGRGFGGRGGMGMGRGRGYRNMYYATGLTGMQRAGMSSAAPAAPIATGEEAAEMRINALKARQEMLKVELESIESKLADA